jgi:hypothetical protein
VDDVEDGEVPELMPPSPTQQRANLLRIRDADGTSSAPSSIRSWLATVRQLQAENHANMIRITGPDVQSLTLFIIQTVQTLLDGTQLQPAPQGESTVSTGATLGTLISPYGHWVW